MTNPFAAAANNAANNNGNNAPANNNGNNAFANNAPANNAAAAMATTTGDASNPEATAPAGNLSDMFSTDVSSGDMAKLTADLGAAVLVRPTEWIESMKTVNGDTAAIRADWIVLDGPNQGELRSNSLVFNVVVRNTLKNVLDGNQPFFVGIVAEGEAKPGKNPPLVFATAEAEHLELAQQAAQAHGWL